MIPSTTTTLRRSLRYLVLAVGAGLVTSCATAPEQTEATATTPDVRPSVSTDDTDEPPPKPSVERPTQEELATSPCGNPDWAQLPPDSEIDGDRKDESDSGESSKPATDADKGEPSSSSKDDSSDSPD